MEIQVDSEVELRTVREEDAAVLFALVDRNRRYLREWLPWLDGTRSPEDSREFVRGQTEKARRREEIAFGIVHVGGLVGICGYNWIDWERRACGLGYWIAEETQGRGIATRVVRALVEHAFGSLDLRSAEIRAGVENWRSRAIADRLGFRFKTIERKAEWLYDHHVDHAVYELVRVGSEGERAGLPGASGSRDAAEKEKALVESYALAVRAVCTATSTVPRSSSRYT